MGAMIIGKFNMEPIHNRLQKYKWGSRVLGSRFSTIFAAMSFLDHSKSNNFVETGTTRQYSEDPQVTVGDGSMTRLFGECVKSSGGHVWTCDIEPSHIENCKLATKEYAEMITYVVDDSLNFLKNFSESIDFLYLDSVDGWLAVAHEHQLKEIEAIYDKLTTETIILLDDLGSKTNLSIPFLKSKGWIQLTYENLPASHQLSQGLMIHKDKLCGS